MSVSYKFFKHSHIFHGLSSTGFFHAQPHGTGRREVVDTLEAHSDALLQILFTVGKPGWHDNRLRPRFSIRSIDRLAETLNQKPYVINRIAVTRRRREMLMRTRRAGCGYPRLPRFRMISVWAVFHLARQFLPWG